MIYLVLREPTATGYVNRFAYTDDPATASVMCGGQSIAVTKGRITSVGEMANRADISQAKGAVAQGVEWSFAIADWDGTARTSAGIYAGQNRFYGWSVAIARHDASTTPVWFNSEDHWCVTDLQIDGTSISVSVGERWALDGRLLAFGDNGAQVPLVVGGHDVWVPTVALEDATDSYLTYSQKNSLSQGNPTHSRLVQKVATFASRKEMLDGFPTILFTCMNEEAALQLFNSATTNGLPKTGLKLCGQTTISEIIALSVYHEFFVDPISGQVRVDQFHLATRCDSFFYANEAATSVRLKATNLSGAIANGASFVDGFSADAGAVKPAGISTLADGILSFLPTNPTPEGFVAMTRIPATCAFDHSLLVGSATYQNMIESIITNEIDALPDFASGDVFSIILIGGGVVPESLTIPFRFVVQDGATDNFTGFITDIDAKLSVSGPLFGEVSALLPFTTSRVTIDSSPSQTVFFPKNGQKYATDAQKFATFSEVSSLLGLDATVDPSSTLTFLLRYAVLYGISSLSFGSSQALVKTGPSSLGSLTALDPYNVARAIIAYPMDSPDSIALNAAIPSYMPAAADFGECMDATKSYTVNGEAIAQEAWLVFGQYVGGFVAAGEPNTSGQGIGEVPTAVALVLGRFEDIVTEPVIEYCNVAGTLTKKAYIANVDLDYDSANPSRFFGGWGIGYDTPLDTIIDATGTWHRQGTGPIPSWTPTTTDGIDYGVGDWYYCIPNPAEPWGILESWFPAPSHDYGYLIWKQCRAAYKVHRVKRGQTYQFNGIYDDSVIGRMWWEAKRNGSRRIEWLCLQPRYLTYSVREDRPLNWAGSSVYIAGSMANYAGYDVSTWDNAGGDQLVVVEKRYNLQTAIATYTVAIPPLATVDTVSIYRDTINAALDRLVDTVDATAVTPKYIDTLEP